MTRITVVMATYNGSRYIKEQLDSLATQSVRPDIIIIRDDQSTDDTAKKINDFAINSPIPIDFKVNSVRLGYSENFLTAASHARTEWVAFCDQDDIWEPDKIKICQREAGLAGVSMIVHQAILIDATGAKTGFF